eukprot:7285806-Pyramimonas_sp.AAC.1
MVARATAENSPCVMDEQQLYETMDIICDVVRLEAEWRRWWRTSPSHVQLHWPQDLGVRPEKPT